jgi:hypothetical protein
MASRRWIVGARRPADTGWVAAAGLIRLRYPATCGDCGGDLARGSLAHWDKAAKTATCQPCIAASVQAVAAPAVEIDRGQAGASAAREWKRRHERREASVRSQHKRLGGLLLTLCSDPHSTTAWAKGALGEQAIGNSLDRLSERGIAVLHDRRIPGSRANIDHLVISQAGVFVVDTKHYKGRVEQRDVGGWFTTDLRLYVDGHDRTKLVAGTKPQVEAVRRALADREEWRDMPVTVALLFMSDDNWSLLNIKPLRFGEVYALWGKALGKLIQSGGPTRTIDIPALERALAAALPPA